MFSPGLYQEAFNGTIAELGIKETYPSNSFFGDLFWASTWLFRASAAGFRTANTTYYEQAMSTTMELACAPPSAPCHASPHRSQRAAWAGPAAPRIPDGQRTLQPRIPLSSCDQ